MTTTVKRLEVRGVNYRIQDATGGFLRRARVRVYREGRSALASRRAPGRVRRRAIGREGWPDDNDGLVSMKHREIDHEAIHGANPTVDPIVKAVNETNRLLAAIVTELEHQRVLLPGSEARIQKDPLPSMGP